MLNYSENRRDFNGLKSHISGQEFSLARQILGLSNGNEQNDPEHHQPCPIHDCDSDDDAFYFREKSGTFHCRKCKFNGDIIDWVAKVKGISKIEAFDIIADYAGFDNAVGNFAIANVTQQNQKNYRQRFQEGTVRKTEYIYTDENSNPHHKVVRTDGIDIATGKPDKTISQWKMINGQWAKGAPDMKYPYRLPEVLQADNLWIVEGEKVADALRAVLLAVGVTDIAVTTSPGGTPSGKLWNKFVQRHPSILEKRIRVFPDYDEPGLKYALTVAAAFFGTNPEADVRFVKLPDLPDGGDFVDWHDGFLAGGKDESAVVETLKMYCEHPSYSAPIVPELCESMMGDDMVFSQEVPEKIGIEILDAFLEQVIFGGRKKHLNKKICLIHAAFFM